jgi:DNA polymerase-3 subunit epsilon
MQLELLTQSAESLSDGFPSGMVILDCETTGGKSTYHRIIELGYLVIDDGRCTHRQQQFINPGTTIPAGIQRLTGIRPEMLEGAPEFGDIADDLLALLSGRVLVAHNARFDYGFLKNEFKRCGLDYKSRPLCSVKFSRRLYPQYKRHGLDQIIRRFRFSIDQRHRAFDDAEIIYRFFLKSTALFHEDDIRATCTDLLKTSSLPVNLERDEVDRLPSSPGVYHFYDQQDGLLYIGKSVNIKSRVMSHFSQDHSNSKDLKMGQKIAHIDYLETPTDFGAQILESRLIKSMQPLHNYRLRRTRKLYQIKLTGNEDAYMRASIEMVRSDVTVDDEKFGLFRSPRQAMKKLEKLADQYFLCHRLLGLESHGKSNNPCFRYQLKRCLGACVCQEPADSYNQRLVAALRDYEIKVWPWQSAIVVEERSPYDSDRVAWHLIDRWRHLAVLDDLSDLYDHGYKPEQDIAADASGLHSSGNEQQAGSDFDLDIYFILVRFLLNDEMMRVNNLRVWRCSRIAEPVI